MPAIIWPEACRPGFADSFIAHEIIAASLSSADSVPLVEQGSLVIGG